MIVSGAFAAYLRDNRAHLNAKFAEARRYQPALDPDAFAEHVRGSVAPIVEAVAAVNPNSVATVAELLYDLSLDLVGREVLGPRSRNPAVEHGWRTLLPGVAPHVAARPLQVLAAVTNALANLAAVEGAKPALWIDVMLGLGKLTSDTDAWLSAGQVVAWRTGMAHFRLGALEACRALEPTLVCAALGLPWGAFETKPTGPVLDRLIADPWLTPELALTGTWRGSGTPTIKTRVGAFRGFGGLFLTPPTVVHDGAFIVSDSEAAWILNADHFGATFHRTGATLAPERNPKWAAAFPNLAPITSSATDGVTTALTTARSHAVYLVVGSR